MPTVLTARAIALALAGCMNSACTADAVSTADRGLVAMVSQGGMFEVKAGRKAEAIYYGFGETDRLEYWIALRNLLTQHRLARFGGVYSYFMLALCSGDTQQKS